MMSSRKRYWTAEIKFEGKRPFLFFAPTMYVEADSAEDALRKLQHVIADELGSLLPNGLTASIVNIYPGSLIYTPN